MNSLPPAKTPPGRDTVRRRLTVREMQIALEAARGLVVAPPSGLPEDQPSPTVLATTPESWVPDHDGPVSLTGVAVPRPRSARKSTARPDRLARRPAASRPARETAKDSILGADLAARAAAAPPVIGMLGACGGAGLTTAAVLLAAGLASATGVLLVGAGSACGSTAVRSRAAGGDVEALRQWAEHPAGALTEQTPGMALADCGAAPFMVAAGPRDARGQVLSGQLGIRLIELARARSRASIVVDWAAEPLPRDLARTATHLLVVAPTMCPGLLAAEYTVELIEQAADGAAAISLMAVDIRGRSPGRAGRAALARLRALRLPTTAIPFDPVLANDPDVQWPALRPRTRAAVLAGLTQVLHRPGATT